jgi:thioredoxin
MSDAIIRCPECGRRNRVRAAAAGKPQCGQCHKPLPWIIDAADETFAETAEGPGVPVLVDFWAPWCGPCRMVAPVLEEIAGEKGDALKIVKLNVDENQQTAMTYEVLSIPTLILFKNGAIAKKVVGAYPKRKLEAELEPALTA